MTRLTKDWMVRIKVMIEHDVCLIGLQVAIMIEHDTCQVNLIKK